MGLKMGTPEEGKKWFEENMGRGGAIPMKPGFVGQESPEKQQPEKPVEKPAKE